MVRDGKVAIGPLLLLGAGQYHLEIRLQAEETLMMSC